MADNKKTVTYVTRKLHLRTPLLLLGSAKRICPKVLQRQRGGSHISAKTNLGQCRRVGDVALKFVCGGDSPAMTYNETKGKINAPPRQIPDKVQLDFGQLQRFLLLNSAPGCIC